MKIKRQGLFFTPPLESNYWGHIFEEVYKSGLYQSFIPLIKKGKVVVDVGANVGITSYFFHDKFETIHAIEPATQHFETLNFMLDYNGIKNVKTHKFALSGENGKSKFYYYENQTMNSLYGSLGKPVSEEEVELKRIDTFFEEEKIKHVDLLKLDCEGVEFEIVCGEGFAKIADKIDTVIGEIHNFSGRHPNQIKDSLESYGFRFSIVPHDATLFIAQRI